MRHGVLGHRARQRTAHQQHQDGRAHSRAAAAALARAKVLGAGAPPVERALIEALATRYEDPPHREDLRKNLDNGWALIGLARSLEAQHRTQDAAVVKERFAKAWAEADVELSSSCFCQPGL